MSVIEVFPVFVSLKVYLREQTLNVPLHSENKFSKELNIKLSFFFNRNLTQQENADPYLKMCSIQCILYALVSSCILSLFLPFPLLLLQDWVSYTIVTMLASDH